MLSQPTINQLSSTSLHQNCWNTISCARRSMRLKQRPCWSDFPASKSSIGSLNSSSSATVSLWDRTFLLSSTITRTAAEKFCYIISVLLCRKYVESSVTNQSNDNQVRDDLHECVPLRRPQTSVFGVEIEDVEDIRSYIEDKEGSHHQRRYNLMLYLQK